MKILINSAIFFILTIYVTAEIKLSSFAVRSGDEISLSILNNGDDRLLLQNSNNSFKVTLGYEDNEGAQKEYIRPCFTIGSEPMSFAILPKKHKFKVVKHCIKIPNNIKNVTLKFIKVDVLAVKFPPNTSLDKIVNSFKWFTMEVDLKLEINER